MGRLGFLCLDGGFSDHYLDGEDESFLGWVAIPVTASVVVGLIFFFRVFWEREGVSYDDAFIIFPSKTANALRFCLPLLWCFALVNGLLCVVVHWLIWPRPPELSRQFPSR
jgi:hypothetical protein